MSKSKKYILLFLIVALGFFLRSYNIENTPPGVYRDEAFNGVDALNAITHGQWHWFYEANNGREGLLINMTAVCFMLFGVSVLSLKLPSIIFGTLTILGTYLLTKELYKKERFALISAFLVATAFWAINFSRISFRANMLPTVLVFSFYFLFRGLRTKKWLDFATGGLIFGLGVHTYTAFGIAPLILIFMFAILIISRKEFLKEYWKLIFVFAIFAIIVATPMLYTFYHHPEYVQSRISQISILNPKINQGDFFKFFSNNFNVSLAKYNFCPDQNWRHNFPPYPILDPIAGISFIFGLIYVFGKLIYLIGIRLYRRECGQHLESYALLISWFFIMLIPEFMTFDCNPHALRSIGTLPPVFVLATFIFEYFFQESDRRPFVFKKIIFSLIVIMIIAIGTFNSIKYHLVWAEKKEVAYSFDKNITEISNYVKTVPKTKKIYIIAESMERPAIEVFNWEAPSISYYSPENVEQIKLSGQNFEIIMINKSDDLINYFSQKIPEKEFQEIKDNKGMSYYILK